MVPVALVAAVVLLVRAPAEGRWATAAFAVALPGLYGISSLYHVPRWSRRAKTLLGRCDTAMIVLFIAGTFTPIAFHTLDGRWRLVSLVVAWAIALVGAGVALSPLRAPRWAAALGYIAMGWLPIVVFARIAAALPLGASGLIVLGGVLYTVGGVVYARRRPDPAPVWFGFHEVFHLLVIAGTVAHYTAIAGWVVAGPGS